jgi:hypothetical protein
MPPNPDVYNREKTLRMLKKYGLKTKYLEDWVVKFRTLRGNAKRRKVKCSLTLSQYVKLVIKAGLTHPNQIGRKKGQYQMARDGDTGDYEWGNCRFITIEENQVEREENGGTEAQIEKLTGRTKENHPGVRASAEKQSKPFCVRSPDGRVYKGVNLKEFANKHGLHQGSLAHVCRGDRLHTKGWTGKYT